MTVSTTKRMQVLLDFQNVLIVVNYMRFEWWFGFNVEG